MWLTLPNTGIGSIFSNYSPSSLQNGPDLSIFLPFKACIQNLHFPRHWPRDAHKYKYHQLTKHSFQTIEARLPLGENGVVKYSLDCSVIAWAQCGMKMQGALFQSWEKYLLVFLFCSSSLSTCYGMFYFLFNVVLSKNVFSWIIHMNFNHVYITQSQF